MKSEAYLMDCMDFMRQIPDNYFSLSVVDPPYGINASKGIGKYSLRKYGESNKNWDDKTPNKEYWNELFRVSKNQIVCGSNYFMEHLYSTKSFICWIKNNPAPTFAEAELIWTSFNVNGKVFDTGRQIIHQIQNDGGSIHPTQKPVALYEWIYHNYLPDGGKVIDTHLGSGSNRIAADKAGNIDFYSTEIDPDYFADQEKRFRQYKAQLTLKF